MTDQSHMVIVMRMAMFSKANNFPERRGVLVCGPNFQQISCHLGQKGSLHWCPQIDVVELQCHNLYYLHTNSPGLHDELATYYLSSKLSRAVHFLHYTRPWILSTWTGDEEEMLC